MQQRSARAAGSYPTPTFQHLTVLDGSGGGSGGGIPEAPSNGQTYGRLNAAWTQVLPLSGGTVTGQLTLGTSTSSGNQFVINGAAQQLRRTFWQTAGSNRWSIALSGEAEAGGNAGANFGFSAFSDTGVNLGSPLVLNRAGGGISGTANVTLASNTANQAPNMGLLFNQTYSGKSSVVNGPVFNGVTINDSIDAAGLANGVIGFTVLHNYGGGTTKGGRTAFTATVAQTQGANTGTGEDDFYVGAYATSFARYSQPGATPTTPLGRVFGFNALGAIQVGFTATNYYQVASAEFDVGLSAGSSSYIRSGVTIADLTGTAQGFGVDNALWIYGGGAKWRNAIMFGDTQAYSIDPTAGTLIGAKMGNASSAAAGVMAAKWGLDLMQIAFPATGNPYDGGVLRSSGLAIDGAGTIQQGSAVTSWSSSGHTIDCKGSVGTGATIAAAGSGYINGTRTEAVTTAYGGLWVVNVASGAPTAVTQLVAPMIASATPPANPVATVTQQANSSGTGLTLNLTWNTTATTLALNPSGGKINMRSLPQSTGTTADLAAKGLVTGDLYNNGGVVCVAP
jgi:hypothetical protein